MHAAIWRTFPEGSFIQSSLTVLALYSFLHTQQFSSDVYVLLDNVKGPVSRWFDNDSIFYHNLGTQSCHSACLLLSLSLWVSNLGEIGNWLCIYNCCRQMFKSFSVFGTFSCSLYCLRVHAVLYHFALWELQLGLPCTHRMTVIWKSTP